MSLTRPRSSALLRHLVLPLLSAVALGAAPAKRPNILFIITDDQALHELKAYNP